MNINHLQYFVDAADLKSCSGSARKNRISQPALSQSILNLEKELGYSILKHKPKSFELTEEGRMLLNYAREILALAYKAKHEVVTQLNPTTPVRIICTQSFFRYYLKAALPALRKKAPAWSISLSFGNRETIKKSLAEGSADLGFLISHESLSSFKVRKLRSGYFYEIASEKPKTTSPLYVTSLKDKEIPKMLKENRRSADLIEIGSWESIYEMVSAQFGSGIVPEYIIRDETLWKKKLLKYDLLMLSKKQKSSPFEAFHSLIQKELT